jgi:gamma-glutamylcyclotransferase (GGCT)/AIG2-like uncharacterized protein YtfP
MPPPDSPQDSSPQDSSPQLPLFAFGTLRRGHENHHFLAGRYLWVTSATLPGWRRGIAAHGFPAVTRDPTAVVEDGELFVLHPAVHADVLAEIDQLEDLPPGELVGPYYTRIPLPVVTGDGVRMAWVYVDPASAAG